MINKIARNKIVAGIRSKALFLAFILAFCFALFGVSFAAQYFYPNYYVAGNILDPDGKGVEGRTVYFYETPEFLSAGVSISAKAGKGVFLINAFGTINPFAQIGKTYYLYIPNDNLANPKEGYGADAVIVKLGGSGVDLVNLNLTKGGGNPVYSVGNPPKFEWLKFGERLYQKALVEKGEKFIVSKNPKISAKVFSETGINVSSLSISVNEAKGAGVSKTFQIKEADIKSKEFSIKDVGAKSVTALMFSYDVPEGYGLDEGANTFKFYAANDAGQTYEVANVTVMSGPVQVIGPVLTFPSPFSPTKHKEVTIQYTLSTDADIDVFVFSPLGEVLKKFVNMKGDIGGAAGINKIVWDGIKPTGRISGNAVYTGAIVAREQGKILARFKLTVVD